MCTKRRLVVIVTVVTLVAVSLVAVSVGVYWQRQGPPPLLTPPYIRLEALLDEPMGHGWGVDIPGYGPSLNFSSLQVVVRGQIDRVNSLYYFGHIWNCRPTLWSLQKGIDMRTCTNSFRRSLNKDLVQVEQFVDRCLFLRTSIYQFVCHIVHRSDLQLLGLGGAWRHLKLWWSIEKSAKLLNVWCH